MDNNFLFLCALQVTLANESIVLYMCEGKVLMDSKFPQMSNFGMSQHLQCGTYNKNA